MVRLLHGGTWTCHDCRFVPSQISQLVKTTQQMSKDIQTIRQLQTSYSKLQNSLDAAYKNNQQLVSQVASKTADCQQLRAQVTELEVKVIT